MSNAVPKLTTGWMVYVAFGPRAKRKNVALNTSVFLLLECGKRKAGDTGEQSGERDKKMQPLLPRNMKQLDRETARRASW